jgi:hypothetical protein
MKYSKLVLLTLLSLGLASSSGCFSSDKPLTEEQKKQIDDDMQKAKEFNAKGGGPSGGTKADDDMQKAIQQNKAKQN